MDDDAYRDDDPEAYWRRRVIILVAGLVALGLIAWLTSGSGGGAPQPAAAVSRAAVAAEQAANGLPAAANENVAPTPLITAGALRPPATAAAPALARPKRARHAPARGEGRRRGYCPAGDIVLSLFSTKTAYRSHERPRFNVYAVSTAKAPCSVSFGTATVHVIISSKQGRIVWNSARCVQPRRQTVRLARGVPVGLSVNWNPAAARPRGCVVHGHAAGWLTARAVMGGQSSPAQFFKFAR